MAKQKFIERKLQQHSQNVTKLRCSLDFILKLSESSEFIKEFNKEGNILELESESFFYFNKKDNIKINYSEFADNKIEITLVDGKQNIQTKTVYDGIENYRKSEPIQVVTKEFVPKEENSNRFWGYIKKDNLITGESEYFRKNIRISENEYGVRFDVDKASAHLDSKICRDTYFDELMEYERENKLKRVKDSKNNSIVGERDKIASDMSSILNQSVNNRARLKSISHMD